MGPLSGFRIIELAGIGPGPFCGMMLADMGAEVIRVDRAGPGGGQDILNRGRRSIAVDLKSDAGKAVVLKTTTRQTIFLPVIGLVDGGECDARSSSSLLLDFPPSARRATRRFVFRPSLTRHFLFSFERDLKSQTR